MNEHNAWVPRDHWLTPAEREAMIRYYRERPGEGYRRLTYMMLDADIVAVSPATTYRVLGEAQRNSNQIKWPRRLRRRFRPPLPAAPPRPTPQRAQGPLPRRSATIYAILDAILNDRYNTVLGQVYPGGLQPPPTGPGDEEPNS